jgi:uncharacterized protein (DUF2141 family)
MQNLLMNSIFDHVSCRGRPFEIRVVIKGVKKSVGLIVAELYPNKEDGFLRGRGRIEQVRFAAKAPATKFCLAAPDAGEYAIAVYQDENANTDFDKGALGLPAEPWGLSNNPKVRFGPPPIEKTLFPVDASGATAEIKLN